jgi:hypothetical protein
LVHLLLHCKSRARMTPQSPLPTSHSVPGPSSTTRPGTAVRRNTNPAAPRHSP